MSWDDAPWTLGNLRITRDAIEQVARAAVAGYLAEEEVCGLLAGPLIEPLLCDRTVPIENLARSLHERDPDTYPRSARTFFAFRERVLEAELRDGRSRGTPIKVLYHSHLDVGAFLSGMDQAMLSRGMPPTTPDGPAMLGAGPSWPIAFLVTSVRRGTNDEPHVDDHRLFIWRKGAFEPSALELL